MRCRVLPNTLTACDCTNAQHLRVPAIFFKIGDDEYMISRESWFERRGNQCTIKFMHSPREEQWILGLNFFHNYYAVFDYENQRIGLTPSINQGKPASLKFLELGMGLMNLEGSGLQENIF